MAFNGLNRPGSRGQTQYDSRFTLYLVTDLGNLYNLEMKNNTIPYKNIVLYILI